MTETALLFYGIPIYWRNLESYIKGSIQQRIRNDGSLAQSVYHLEDTIYGCLPRTKDIIKNDKVVFSSFSDHSDDRQNFYIGMRPSIFKSKKAGTVTNVTCDLNDPSRSTGNLWDEIIINASQALAKELSRIMGYNIQLPREPIGWHLTTH